MIKKCDCKHEYQDKKYGKGKRVMNAIMGGKKAAASWRCTVCEKEHA